MATEIGGMYGFRVSGKHNVTVVVPLLLTESFDVAVFTVYSVLMNVNNLFTLIHFHLFQNMYYVSNNFMHYS